MYNNGINKGVAQRREIVVELSVNGTSTYVREFRNRQIPTKAMY